MFLLQNYSKKEKGKSTTLKGLNSGGNFTDGLKRFAIFKIIYGILALLWSMIITILSRNNVQH